MGYDPRDPSLPPAQPFGPFFLDRRIAVGGSAEVYLAHPKLGERPAPRLVVKRLLGSARARSDLGALAREAELHRAVQHPNVVTVYGAGEVNGEPYIAMEYVEGVDVYRLLRRAEAEQRRLSPALAAHVARQVAEALASVHDARDADGRRLDIVHRDINPSNVYLSVTGAVKVGDFGIARAGASSSDAAPASVGLKGKFGYLSPEQVAGEPFDHRADLFALTALLGEMLIGERVFPGSGELAVLLAIRDGDYERLRERSRELPPGLYALCQRGLARRPEARFQLASAMSAALAAFELPSPEELRRELADWVRWAMDDGGYLRKIEGRIRDSVQRMRAVQRVTHQPPVSSLLPSAPVTVTAPLDEPTAKVRRLGSARIEPVPFPKLLELVATGELCGRDEVALVGDAFRAIEDVDELARHLLPSNTQTTLQLHEPGVPDYQVMLSDTPMNVALAYLRTHRETGALFVTRQDGEVERRKEIYLQGGRLHHVASSDRAELLGEYLVRRGALQRGQLDGALAVIARRGGRLGDTLIGLGHVEPIDLFRAIRDQGRDRVAALCAWTHGRASFYRGTVPSRVEFPLELDLASPMMAGVIISTHGAPATLLPARSSRIVPGPRATALADERELGYAPSSLQSFAEMVADELTIELALSRVTAPRTGRGSRTISEKEACAALVVARDLGWLDFVPAVS